LQRLDAPWLAVDDRTRRRETFGVAAVHKILTNTVYIGELIPARRLSSDRLLPRCTRQDGCHQLGRRLM
jgi:hypothetical protein